MIRPTPASLLEAARRRIAGAADPMLGALELDFQPLDGPSHRAAWRRLAAAVARTGLPRDLVVYVHVPFCRSICSFCALAVERAPTPEALDAYVDGLVREAASWAPDLGDLRVSTVHLGGGTPSLLSPKQLDRLLTGIERHLPLRIGFGFGVELLPSTTTASKLEVLAAHGVRRASFGVQSFNPAVLRQAHRAYQTHEDVARAVALARAAGIDDINVDVLVGLPGETDEAIEHSVRAALALETRSMSLNRNLAESSPLSAHGWVPSAAEVDETTRRLQRADALVWQLRPPNQPATPARRPGYGVQYVWAAPDEARAYFQEDMNGPASVLPLGHGATGHLHGMMYMVPAGTWQGWVERALAGAPHDMLAASISPRQEMAAFVARALTRGRCESRRFEALFGVSLDRAFGARLRALQAEGAARAEGTDWSLAGRDRPGYLELLTALGLGAEELRHAPAPAPRRRGPAPSLAPLEVQARAVSVEDAAAQGRVAAEIDLFDDPVSPATRLHHRIEALREAGTRHLTIWTTPEALADEERIGALTAAPPDLLMLRVRADETAIAEALSRAPEGVPLGLFLRWGASDGEGLVHRLERLALAGAPRVLVELDAPVSAEVALALWRLASRRRPELALVFEDPETEWRQYAHIREPMPDSIVISRVAFRAARANRRTDGGFARFHRRFGRAE